MINTPDSNNRPSSIEANQPTAITPETLGFAAIEGRDIVRGAAITLNNAVERKQRWEKALDTIARVTDRTRAYNALSLFIRQNDMGMGSSISNEVISSLTYANGVIGSFNNPEQLKAAVTRGTTPQMQEIFSIPELNDNINTALTGQVNPDVGVAILGAIVLAKELYAQNHGGDGYQRERQKEMIGEARKNPPNVR